MRLTDNIIYANHVHMRIKMERTNIFATPKQLEQLREIAKESGLPMAEIIRRAIDMFLEATPEKQPKE